MKILILILSILMASNAWCAAVDPLNQNDPNFIAVLNDDLQKINGQQILLATSYPATRLSGIVTPAQGGTGQDFSAIPANNIIYSSGIGTIGNIGIGTTGQFLAYGTPPAWSTPKSTFTAGDYSLIEDNAFYQENSSSPTKHSEFYLTRSGTLRIKFYLGNGAGDANGRIYRNGSAVGTARNGTGLYSEDISGWSAGDLCQLYINDTTGGNSIYGGAFQLFEGTPSQEGINRSTYPVQRRYLSPVAPATALLNGLGSVGDYLSSTAGGASTTLYVKTGASTWTAK